MLLDVLTLDTVDTVPIPASQFCESSLRRTLQFSDYTAPSSQLTKLDASLELFTLAQNLIDIATPEQIAAHSAASRRGALEGALAAGSVATVASVYAHRRFAYYRALPPSLKVLGVLVIAAPALSIQAERRGLEYDKSQWEGDGAQVLQAQEAHELSRWEKMSTGDKIADWAHRHEYSIIIGGWALSLALAGGIISRDKYQTTAQKVVQARMWAQGLTIGIILTAAGFKANRNIGESASRPVADHSWMEMLEQQERERQEEERIKQRIASAQRRGAPDVPS
ncbi:hypothetical protein DFH07DRAFT_953711 [Mycena maculata]|uniref:HIG1 domain-containing protein n=1 Tax=Mycena maculata TaxID=230809 RepID=A0AAD7NQ76_9AGAR|nr:hypothetical protein DFH07DRAFT_953711 [Mycena maculata]